MVLLIRQDGIGDFVIWLDTAKEYRKLYPPDKYKIVLAGNKIWCDLAEELPYWDKIIPTDVKQFKTFSSYRWKLLRKIRKLKIETAIQPTYSREFYLGDSLIRASLALRKVSSEGDMSNRNWLKKIMSDRWHTELIPASTKKMTELERNSEFFQALSKKPHKLSYPSIICQGTASHTEWENSEYYVLFPGVSSALRQWPLECFAEIANRIYHETCLTGILDGRPNEKPFAESIKELSDAPLEWAGTRLNELPVLLKCSRFVVTSETSAVHIAVAVNTPVICILGGAYFGRFLPYPELPKQRIVLETVSYSMPCYGCNSECIYPLKNNESAPCITNVSVDAVWEKVKPLLTS
ncbi:MAG: glycosyltransferase family 9 protein [SAR324 cluster bacterium]|nr:glycosyltransferase family 9 protein [SAR324 cluster bacterium]